MKVVKTQKVILTFGSGDTIQNGTLSGFDDLARTIPMSVSMDTSSECAIIAQGDFDVEVTSLTNVRATRGASGIACTVIVYIVQFPNTATVQKNTWSLGTGDTSTNVTLSTVVMANTFTLLYRKCDTNSVLQPDVQSVGAELTSTTNVAITKEIAGGVHSGHVYTVTHSDLSVQRGSEDVTTVSPASITISSVNIDHSFCICSQTSGSTTWEDEGYGHLKIDSSTSLEFNLGTTFGDVTVKWQVVEDSDISVQRSDVFNVFQITDDVTITAVDTDFSIIMPGHMPGCAASQLYNDANDVATRNASYNITSSTNVTWTKRETYGSIAFEVVEFQEEEGEVSGTTFYKTAIISTLITDEGLSVVILMVPDE